MDQDNVQLNTDELDEGLTEKRKRNKLWDIFLWMVIAVLAIAVCVRVFVISNVEVSGESMTAAYYNLQDSEHYNPDLTYHDEQIVKVNKLAKLKRGDVVVFYENPVKNKFSGNFARGKSVEKGGEYYKLIKRVVAVGGDRLWVEQVEDNKYRLVVETSDGEILHEDSYTKNGEKLDIECFIMPDSCLGHLNGLTETNPLIIQEGYFFAMGDNRVNSADSRGELGPVPLSQLFGIVLGR